MKLTLAFLLCLLGLSNIQAQIQSNSERPIIRDPVKFDDYGKILWGDEKARLDNAAIHLQREPANFVLYLVAYGGQRACFGEAQARLLRAKNYLVGKRGLASSRVVSIDGGYREEQTVEIWLLPRDLGKPSPTPTVEKSEVQLRDCRLKNGVRRRRLGP
jgi:hypothetical protein